MEGFNLLTKLSIFNFTAICTLIAVTWAGFVIPTFQADESYISYIIVGMFVYGLLQIYWFASGMVKDHVLDRFAHVSDIADYLVMLGLLGTAIGILIALGGVEFGSSVSDLKTVTNQLLAGTKIAFHSTIVGGFAWLWHHVNCRIVYTGLKTNEV